MEEKELLTEWDRKLKEVYIEHELTCIAGLKADYIYNGRQLFSWYHDVVRKNWIKHNGAFSYFKNVNDLLRCSDTLLFHTAHLFLYAPYIDNPLKNAFQIEGEWVYPNYENIEGKRYDMFLDTNFQSLYNYWARVGDLIASFFTELIERKKVDFARALDVIPSNFHSSENYKWLIDFKNNEYKEFNTKRKLIVHCNSLSTKRRNDHIGNHMNREAIEEMQKEREFYPEYFKNHIRLSLSGLEKTLLFLEEINLVLFKEE